MSGNWSDVGELSDGSHATRYPLTNSVNVFVSLHCVKFCITSFLLSFVFEIIWCLCYTVLPKHLSHLFSVNWILGWIACQSMTHLLSNAAIHDTHWNVERCSVLSVIWWFIDKFMRFETIEVTHTVNLSIELRQSPHRFNQDCWLVVSLQCYWHEQTFRN